MCAKMQSLEPREIRKFNFLNLVDCKIHTKHITVGERFCNIADFFPLELHYSVGVRLQDCEIKRYSSVYTFLTFSFGSDKCRSTVMRKYMLRNIYVRTYE